jgi:hypothetical protein
MTYRDKHGMLRNTFILQPFTEATNSDAGGFPDRGIWIL